MYSGDEVYDDEITSGVFEGGGPINIRVVDMDQPEAPDEDTLMGWMNEGGCEATDGCWVEVDGTCPHDKPSWALVMGLV